MRRIIFIFLLCLVGCTMTNHQKLYPLPKSGVVVIGDKIYYDDKIFAELRYFTDRYFAKKYNMYKKGSYLGIAIYYYPYDKELLGIAIYYYPYDKELWIFPQNGWSVRVGAVEYFTVQDVEMIWEQYQIESDEWMAGKRDTPPRYKDVNLLSEGKELKVRPVVFDVKISSDGKYVAYKTSGMFFDSSHKYLVEYGFSK